MAINMISAYQNNISSVYGTESVERVQSIQKDDESKKSSIVSDNIIEDKAIISDEAKALYESEQAENNLAQKNKENDALETEKKQEDAADKETEQTKIGNKKDELTQAEEQQVTKLKRIDSEVKAHEQAHKAAAGGLSTSAASYEYEVGPDGEKYAVAGEVSISYRKSSDPEQNLANAKKVKAAALAPADPSSTDKAVARNASAEIAQAQKEIQQQQKEESTESKTEETDDSNKEVNEKTSQEKTTSSNDLISSKNDDKNEQAINSIPINVAETTINPSAQPQFANA